MSTTSNNKKSNGIKANQEEVIRTVLVAVIYTKCIYNPFGTHVERPKNRRVRLKRVHKERATVQELSRVACVAQVLSLHCGGIR